MQLITIINNMIDHMNENVENIFNYLRVYNPENVHRLSL